MVLSPIYIVSKNRWDRCLTAKALDLLAAPYRVIIEEDQVERYANHVGFDKLLVLPKKYLNEYETCDDLGDTKSKGPGAARNFAMDHSIRRGNACHWVMDDNLHDFHRLHKNRKIPVRSSKTLEATEYFVNRYINVPIAGLNYYSFCKSTDGVPPFTTNTRIYSCLLIRNNIGLRWRGRYNEDTDLSLRVLKRGECTIQMNAYLCGKVTTQRMSGGNTEEFYTKEGTLPKSQMLSDLHPDVAKVVWRYNRWHHHVDYRPFRNNLLTLKDNADLINGKLWYDMKCVSVPYRRADETPEKWQHFIREKESDLK